MRFAPIAVVGRACLLPGARSPEALFALAREGRDVLSDAPAGRWRVPDDHVLTTASEAALDRTWTRRGGYVEGFAFDPSGYRVEASRLEGLDPLTQWVLDTARRALVDAGALGAPGRVTATLGNLSLPSSGAARFAERVWLGPLAEGVGLPATDPRDRFNSGLPALLLAEALGLSGPALSLDAACASSLYAIELACRDLQEGRADRAIAGAVNRADDLFLHVGFCALGAMSKTGQSRPFHADADGLVPGEGCGVVVLERLEDAVRAGRTIHGVIRGVGLANDGRGKGLLAPSAAGQARSMRNALAQAGLSPDDVPYVECHATGTTVGDATELASMGEVYRGGARIGSLKANLGHLITAAGAAGLVKVLESLREGVALPTPNLERPSDALRGSAFDALSAPAPWVGPRRAGLSAFGFGGNDAHLIVEAYEPTRAFAAVPAPPAPRVAVVALGARVGAGQSSADLERALAAPAQVGAWAEVRMPMRKLRFPPADLQKASAQQTMLLSAALEATEGLTLPRETTGVFVGYQCDPEIARWGARWRARAWGEALDAPSGWAEELQARLAPPLEAAHVLGTLPNIPANRLSSQLDLGGPSYTTSSEEHSGLAALEIAAQALARGDVDAAIVGAVDRSTEPVHASAAAALGDGRPRGDAAVALVLRRLDDARAEGLTVLAELELDGPGEAFATGFPVAHAAAGLVEVAGAVVRAARGLRPDGAPWTGERRLRVEVPALGASRTRAVAVVGRGAPLPALPEAADGPHLTMPARAVAVQVPAVPAATRVSVPAATNAPPPAPSPMPVAPRARPETTPMQTMQPAPSLPPTTHEGPPAAPVSAHEPPAVPTVASPAPGAAVSPGLAAPAPGAPAQASLPVPAVSSQAYLPTHVRRVAAASAAHAASPDIPPGSFLAAFTDQQARLADAHRAFVEQQAALHTQMLTALLGAPAAMPVAAMPVAAMPVAAMPVAAMPAAAMPVAAMPVAAMPAAAMPAPGTTSTPPTQAVASPPPSSPASVVQAPPALQRTAPSPAPAPSAAASPPAPAASTPRPSSAEPAAELPLALRPRGPSFTREELAIHAGGRISTIFGADFARQDDFPVQVRMPEPPLLLADRCTGMDAEPGSMQKGVCWTETDVREDSWYLHDGHMPCGIMVESGQADLFLISYLGADFLNCGERAYRLLGCEMTWLGDLPAVGETLAYDIHVDGHAAQGDVRLFFFHYDCHLRLPDGSSRPALKVRGGQAGFFTEGELADSAGILWRPEQQEILADARVDPPAAPVAARSFEREAIEAFADGRPWDCFGPAFTRTKTHTRTPRIQGGRMLFLDRIEAFDPEGGPWGRGYLKAVTPIAPDDWYFEGHFKNDPCMPGTLMLEGCVQAMAFYLSALGYTIDRDGWRFTPIPHETYSLRCRGQVTPKSRELTYEVFVEEVHDGPEPMLYADLLCVVDGLGAFHARRFGLKLTPSWPLTSHPELLAAGAGDPRAATASFEGGPAHRFDYPSLLACAWGRPSTAFGSMYERFDGVRRTPRLPGPPYHFLSRVTKVDGAMGGLEAGKTLEFEYDVPPDAWYFDENGARVMPFAVLLEAALQPCGWTASYVGSTLTSDKDFLFRNLDGKGTIKAEVLPDSGTLRTSVTITNISRSAGMIIESFQVRCFLGDVEVYELDTVFGFFPPEAFEDQAGLPTSDAQRAAFDAPANVTVDLTSRPPRLCAGTLRLAEPMLLMIDRVTTLDLEGGAAGLGVLRAEKDVDAGEWSFKAHFYQDPVQPGSLGIEAMLQLLQVYMIEAGLGDGLESPRFEAIATDLPHVWKYRGQVVPENRVVTTTLEVVERGEDDKGVYALADASLWVDGKRIYEAKRLGMRIVEGAADDRVAAAAPSEELLDPATDAWLGDHRPTYTAPALPMMSMLDRLVGAARAAGREVDGVRDLAVERWLVVDGPTRLKTEIDGDEAHLYAWRDAPNPKLSRFERVASARLGAPAPFEELAPLGPTEARDPYADDRLFHGPAFHLVTRLDLGAAGARATLDAAAGAVPYGAIHQGLFDAATHAVPHDALSRWSDRIGDDVVGYPHRLDARLLGPAPREGEVTVEARFEGFDGDDARFPVIRLQLAAAGRVFADLRLVEILMPKGPLGAAEPSARRRFLRERAPTPGVSLSRADGDATVLRAADVRASDWFPGTMRAVYGTTDPREIAVQEHVAARVGAHPSAVAARDGYAVDAHAPLTRYPVSIRGVDELRVTDAGPPALDLEPVRAFWRGHFGVGEWPVEDLYFGLIERFVEDVRLEDPEALAAVRGRAALYLGNHQVGIESLLFSVIVSALQGVPTLTLAKDEHRTSWLGELIATCFAYPGVEDPGVIAYFDRSDPSSLPRIAGELASAASARSLMVHVEGTRAQSATHRVEKMSGIFCDLAIQAGVPVIPVRFTGGLPVEPSADKLEYPVGYGRQRYWIGRPIAPAELAAMPYKDRNEAVMRAINRLGPAEDTPRGGDSGLATRAAERASRTGVGLGLATVAQVLVERPGGGEETARLRRSLEGGLGAGLGTDPRGAWLERLVRLLSSP